MPKLPQKKPRSTSPFAAKINPQKVPAPSPPPPRVSKDYAPMHCYSDGKGGVWTHEGRSRDCRKPDCVQWHQEQAMGLPPWDPDNTTPRGYSDEHVESWKEDTRPDALAPCPLTGGKHRWQYGDDGKGHSGDVCKCGAFEE